MRCNIDEMCSVTAEAYNTKRSTYTPVEHMGEGMRSIYMLSLLELTPRTTTGFPV